jgi:hypothetical protein
LSYFAGSVRNSLQVVQSAGMESKMASFCSGCGFPQGPNVSFCPNCGARQQGTPAPTQPPPQPPAPAAVAAPAAGMSTGAKVAITLVVAMAVLGMAAVGGVWYVAHRVKQAVIEKAKAAGVDLPGSIVTHSSATPRHIPKPCEVLSANEVSSLLGQPIERTQVQEESCNYYGPAGLTTKLASEHANATAQKMKSTGSVSESEVMSSMEQIADSVSAQQGNTGAGGDFPFLMLMLDPNGKGQMTALSLSKTFFNGITNASGAGSSGYAMGAEIPGLGDRAIRLDRLGLNVLKGELLIRVVTGPVDDPNGKSVAVARAVLKKLD